jgi:class 3 adenylate cyclase
VLKAASPLQTRVGITTGLVVVGDLIGSGEAQERGIVGETPNLAARLQGIAEPNTIVIAENTRKLLGGLFELEDLGQKGLKGISEPVMRNSNSCFGAGRRPRPGRYVKPILGKPQWLPQFPSTPQGFRPT